MKMRFLGKTGLKVSEICLGVANFGAVGVYVSSGRIEQKEASDIISMALDAGINFFNTAERYSYGVSEEVFGRAIGSRRKDAIVITKISPARKPGPNDGGMSRKHIIEGCEASLKRIGTDYIDIYEMHEFDRDTDLEVSLRALDDLVRDGKIRHFGCSNFAGWQLMKALSISDRCGWQRFSTLESKYSLGTRWLEYELVPVCLDQGVPILAYSPMHGGMLAGKYRRNQPWPRGTRFQDRQESFSAVEMERIFTIVDEIEKVSQKHNISLVQTALGYVLRKPGVCSVITGVRAIDQFKDIIQAGDWEMPHEDVACLDSVSEPPQEYPYRVFDPEAGVMVKL
ncbi:MAG: aldo/keto reductase [Dehalococcoidales bacterium]|nr:aldo/keto reductase [Dehalococcoidales bacterium]